MTEKIYEYRDGTWAGFNYFTCFGDDQVFEAIQKDFHHLLDQLQESGLQIHVVSYQSRFRLLAFLIQMIKDKTHRPLELRQQACAILVTEGDRLVALYLPEKGLPWPDR